MSLYFLYDLYKLSKNKAYKQNVETFRKDNMYELEQKIKDITVHQGTIEEVSNGLGVSLEMVETGKPEKFIEAEDLFLLRVKAYLLNANMIVHYQPTTNVTDYLLGSSFEESVIGTPVRIKK